MIVKVQISLNDGGKTLMIYNETRTRVWHIETTPEIRRLLGDRLKVYLHVVEVGDKLAIVEEADPQDW